MRNYYNMVVERRTGCGDLPGGVTPQASKKLSPSHRSPDPPRPLPRPHRHCPLVRAVGTAGTDSTAEMVDGPAPCGGRCWRRRTALLKSAPSSVESTGCCVLWCPTSAATVCQG